MNKLSKLSILHLFVFIFLLLSPLGARAQVSVGPWNTTLGLPFQIASHVSEFVNGKLYAFGRATSFTIPMRVVGDLDPSGLISSWNNLSTALPNELFWHSSSRRGSDVYVLGGSTLNPLAKSSNVYLGNVVLGDILSWTNLNPLPNA